MSPPSDPGRPISFDPTWTKRGVPLAVLGFGLFGIVFGGMSLGEAVQTMMVMSLLAAVAWFYYRPIVDEVTDFGDHFVMRRGAVSARVGLDEIVGVDPGSQRTMRFRLARPCALGDRLRFYYNPRAITPNSIEQRARAHRAQSAGIGRA